MTNRRGVLLSFGGVVTLAGCSEISQLESESGSEDQSEAEPTADEDPNETDTENQTQEEPEQEDEEEEEEEEEPTDEELLEQYITKAEEQFKLALAEFGENADGENSSFIDVYPSTEFGNDQLNAARDYLNEADDIIWEDARDYTSTESEEKRVREYRIYDDLISNMGRVQWDIYRAYTVFRPVGFVEILFFRH